MGSSLSNLLNSLSEGIHKIKCKYRQDDKKCKDCGTEYKYCNCFLEYRFFKGDLIKCKGLSCDKNYQYKLDKKLEKIFINTCNFSNHNNSRFIDLLQKGINILWIYGWLEKIQWNIITWKRRFLHSPIYGRYYWCRLCTQK